jgi:hypothetical protein
MLEIKHGPSKDSDTRRVPTTAPCGLEDGHRKNQGCWTFSFFKRSQEPELTYFLALKC